MGPADGRLPNIGDRHITPWLANVSPVRTTQHEWPWRLLHRDVQRRPRRVVERGLLDVARDADDREPRIV